MDGVSQFLCASVHAREMADVVSRPAPRMLWGLKAAARKEIKAREAKAQELRREIRKYLDARGFRGDVRKQWWAEFRRLAKEQHGIAL